MSRVYTKGNTRPCWWIIQGSNLERTGYEPAALPLS